MVPGIINFFITRTKQKSLRQATESRSDFKRDNLVDAIVSPEIFGPLMVLKMLAAL